MTASFVIAKRIAADGAEMLRAAQQQTRLLGKNY